MFHRKRASSTPVSSNHQAPHSAPDPLTCLSASASRTSSPRQCSGCARGQPSLLEQSRVTSFSLFRRRRCRSANPCDHSYTGWRCADKADDEEELKLLSRKQSGWQIESHGQWHASTARELWVAHHQVISRQFSWSGSAKFRCPREYPTCTCSS